MARKNKTQEKLDRIALDKMAVNEAIQDWMDRKWSEFQKSAGSWFLRALVAILFALAMKGIFWLVLSGHLKPSDVNP